MKKTLLMAGLLTALSAFPQSYNGPESVEFDYVNNRWLIGNKNNGTVIARDMSGNFSSFVSGMTSGPYGIEILGNTLYCCHNGGSLRGFDLSTGAQVFNLNLGGTFLNGICSDGVNTLYVTDFSAKTIYRVNVANSTSNIFVSGLSKSPNGIIYDSANARLVFVTWGTNALIQQVALSDSSVTTLATTALSNIDGIAADSYGNHYISTWGGNAIRKFSNNFTTGPTTVQTGFSSPADIFYNTVTDTLAVPNSGTANNVVWIGFSTASIKEETSLDHVTEIFPRPAASGEFFIRNTKEKIIEIKLFDLTGKLVYHKNISGNVPGSSVKINVNLPAGIYFAELGLEGKHETVKLVIE